jgi:hypothetical protein
MDLGARLDVNFAIRLEWDEESDSDRGSGFALSNAEAEAVHFKKPSSVNFALTSASLILLWNLDFLITTFKL